MLDDIDRENSCAACAEGEQHAHAAPWCTRYVSGGGRHRLQARCPLAPRVACSPDAREEYARP